jgi:N,N'-diacetyllegionaminate synthase
MSEQLEIIAELAQGFEGRADQARLLVRAAAAAGADAAKLQLVFADELAARGYQHYDLFTGLEMPDDTWRGLAELAVSLRIELQVDIFGAKSLALAEAIGLRTIKLHPTDVANVGLLEAVAKSKIPRVLLGAGGTHASELDRALEQLSGKSVVVLLGFQAYPTADADNQIARLRVVADRWGANPRVALGFADHAAPEAATRYALAATAVGAGATVIEKHLTLGRHMKLEDHESALNPDEFKEFVTTLRACGQALGGADGSDDFGMSAAEQKYRSTIRRHVVAARDLPAGSRLTPADVTLKRTASAQPITVLDSVYGRTLARDVRANAPIEAADLT